MDIRQQIKTIMIDKGISPYRISKDIDVSEAQLSKFFNCKVNLSLNKLIQIVEYLDCEIIITPRKDA